MTLDGVLTRLTQVRKSGKGWMAQCPAHEDTNPSLSVSEGYEGRVLLKCFAGCSFRDIAKALNLPRSNPLRTPLNPRPIDWKRLAHIFQFRAESYWLKGQEVLEKVKGYDITTWNEEELEGILDHVGRALKDLEQAEYLEDTAAHLRLKHIQEKKHKTKEGHPE